LLLLAFLPFIASIVRGRRSELALLAAIIAGLLYFVRGYNFPRWAIMLGLVAGFIVHISIADYRQLYYNTGLSTEGIAQIDIFQNLEKSITGDERNFIPETAYGFYLMDVVSRNSWFEYGGAFWDRLVHQYVPA